MTTKRVKHTIHFRNGTTLDVYAVNLKTTRTGLELTGLHWEDTRDGILWIALDQIDAITFSP